jgi:hypothetical protein
MWWPPRLGEPLPRGSEAVGVHHKLETYSLARKHSRGGPKALVEIVAESGCTLGIVDAPVDSVEVTWLQGVTAVA